MSGPGETDPWCGSWSARMESDEEVGESGSWMRGEEGETEDGPRSRRHGALVMSESSEDAAEMESHGEISRSGWAWLAGCGKEMGAVERVRAERAAGTEGSAADCSEQRASSHARCSRRSSAEA